MEFKKIGMDVKIFETSKIVYPENIEIGNNVIIDDFTLIIAKKQIRIGDNVHIASFVSMTGNDEVIIEDFVGISSGVRIFSSTDDYVGSYLNNPTVPNEFKNIYTAPVIFRKFALVGANTVIMPGAVIEEGTSIGANSLVYNKTKPYSVYLGNPIRLIGVRDKSQILALEQQYLRKNSN